MKTLSDRHLENIQKLAIEEKKVKKAEFLKKVSSLLEKYNCNSIDELNEANSIKFIQDMLTEDKK